ncbi:hypothetical protein BdWA1_002612 [Babesia duncani]|uniref:Uncharacterized protein n=1 Tax=Babesia duncani TaxID=323732 RepID=A0AAD9UNL0_9APIC|nr:hypothetical protein BdWA1_002612 [Babesia duncani]
MEDNDDESLVYSSPSEKPFLGTVEEVSTPKFFDIFDECDPETEEIDSQSDYKDLVHEEVTFSDRVVNERKKLELKQFNGHGTSSPSSSKNNTIACNIQLPETKKNENSMEKVQPPKNSFHDVSPRSLFNEWLHKKMLAVDRKYSDITSRLQEQFQRKQIGHDMLVALSQENMQLKCQISHLTNQLDQVTNELIVERKHNETAIVEKSQCINRIQLYTLEIKDLVAGQQEIEKNRIREQEQWQQRESELLKKNSQLENDVHHFMNKLHQSQLLVDKQATQIVHQTEMEKSRQSLIDRLQQELKTYREANLNLKAQNQSLIEVNESLRSRGARCYYKCSEAIIEPPQIYTHIENDETRKVQDTIEPLALPSSSMSSITTMEQTLYNTNLPSSPASTLGDATSTTASSANATTEWMMQRVMRSTSQDSLASLKEQLKVLYQGNCRIKTPRVQ